MKKDEEKHQRKFYSTKTVDEIVNKYAKVLKLGFSETLRAIVEEYEYTRNNPIQTKRIN